MEEQKHIDDVRKKWFFIKLTSLGDPNLSQQERERISRYFHSYLFKEQRQTHIVARSDKLNALTHSSSELEDENPVSREAKTIETRSSGDLDKLDVPRPSTKTDVDSMNGFKSRDNFSPEGGDKTSVSSAETDGFLRATKEGGLRFSENNEFLRASRSNLSDLSVSTGSNSSNFSLNIMTSTSDDLNHDFKGSNSSDFSRNVIGFNLNNFSKSNDYNLTDFSRDSPSFNLSDVLSSVLTGSVLSDLSFSVASSNLSIVSSSAIGSSDFPRNGSVVKSDQVSPSVLSSNGSHVSSSVANLVPVANLVSVFRVRRSVATSGDRNRLEGIFSTENSTLVLAQLGGTATMPCLVNKLERGVVSHTF